MEPPVTILIVDDSRIFRAAIEAAFSGQPGLTVVGSVFSGQKALEFIQARPPDLVTLDVEMPGLDGLQTLEAIQLINRGRPPGAEIGVLMLSAFTQRGADVTVKALQSGAFDFVTKPSGSSPEESIERLRNDLLPRVRLFVSRRTRSAAGAPPRHSPQLPSHSPPSPITTGQLVPPRVLRAVLIGASTGGPKALSALLPELHANIDAPILVVQHMPAEFTRSLAENLTRQLAIPVHEVEEGCLLQARVVYVARGGRHLVLRHDAQGRLVAGLNELPPESGCRPSASVLFRSAAAVVGRESAAIVLTGMGNDGTAGLGALHRTGAFVVAQDEESSVVWGMPGSAVAAGVVDAVRPLHEIAAAVRAVSARRSHV